MRKPLVQRLPTRTGPCERNRSKRQVLGGLAKPRAARIPLSTVWVEIPVKFGRTEGKTSKEADNGPV